MAAEAWVVAVAPPVVLTDGVVSDIGVVVSRDAVVVFCVSPAMVSVSPSLHPSSARTTSAKPRIAIARRMGFLAFMTCTPPSRTCCPSCE